MSDGKAKVLMVSMKKFFSCEIEGFDHLFHLDSENLIKSTFTCPVMIAKNNFDDKEYRAQFKLDFVNEDGDVITFKLKNEKDFQKVVYYYFYDNEWVQSNQIYGSVCQEEIMKLRADIVFSFVEDKAFFESTSKRSLAECFANFFISEPADKFTLKCDGSDIQASKTILSIRSPVFKAMIGAPMKEWAENSAEVVEFSPEVVKKMVEFCETDKVENLGGCASDLYRIAHKYQMKDLMLYALEKMSGNLNFDNFTEYLNMAEVYDMKDFKRWIMTQAGRLSQA